MAFLVFVAILLLTISIIVNVWEYNVKVKAKAWASRYEQTEHEKKAIKTVSTTKLWIYLAFIAVFLVISAFDCFYTIDERQIGYTMTFGYTEVIERPGLNFKFPFITKVKKHDATARSMTIGYTEETNETVVEDSLMITSDFNFLNVDFYIDYRISDPVAYDYGSSNPELILKSIAQATIRNTVGLYEVDFVLTTGKSEIEARVKESIIAKLQEHNTGLTIINVTMQDVEPPTYEVNQAFEAVETAIQNAEKLENDANSYKNSQIPKAEAEAKAITNAAEATKAERINQANQEVAEFNALYNEYKANPTTVKLQLYLDAMKEILPNMEVIIGKDSKVVIVNNEQ